MPSIKIYALPNVVAKIPHEKMGYLSQLLRVSTASTLQVDLRHVKALWIPVKSSQKAASIAIEISYSVKPDFNPDEATRIALADKILDKMANQKWLPEGVKTVTCWVKPQHDAVFKVLKRG